MSNPGAEYGIRNVRSAPRNDEGDSGRRGREGSVGDRDTGSPDTGNPGSLCSICGGVVSLAVLVPLGEEDL